MTNLRRLPLVLLLLTALAVSLLHAIYRWPLEAVSDGALALRGRIEQGNLRPVQDWTPSADTLSTLYRALAVQPEDRFENMEDMLRELAD